MKVIASFNASAGNESVGDMWTEEAIFDESATLLDVLKWAKMVDEYDANNFDDSGPSMKRFTNHRRNLRLSIAQEPKSQPADAGKE